MKINRTNSVSCDILILGAGVIGSAIAYYLSDTSQLKSTSIHVISDAHTPSTSSISAGMLSPDIESLDALTTLHPYLLQSRHDFTDLVQKLETKTKISCNLFQDGCVLCLNDVKEEQHFIHKIRSLKASHYNILSQAMSQVRYPFLCNPHKLVFFEHAGQIHAKNFLHALQTAAQMNHVKFINDKIMSVKKQGTKILYVETQNNRFSAGTYIFSIGSWSDDLMKILEIKQKIVTPTRGQLLIYRTDPQDTIQNWTSPIYIKKMQLEQNPYCYVVPKPPHHIVIGGTMEENNFDKQENKLASLEMKKNAEMFLHGLTSCKLEQVVIGYRPTTKDKIPILDRMDPLQNTFIATGHTRSGIILSPISAQIIRDLVLNPRKKTDNLFSLQRFF